MVMFDMSGTTIKDYNEVMDCFLEAAESTGIQTYPQQINEMMGWSKIDVFRKLWSLQLPDAEIAFTEEQAQFSFQRFKVILEDWYITHEIEPAEGTIETFEWLRKNQIMIALGTGFYRKVADIILDKLGWLDGLDSNYMNTGHSPVDYSVTSDQVQYGRPAPDMIYKAMSVFGISSAKEIIKIGDTPSDLQEGINASCFMSLGITSGTHTENELRPHLNHGLLRSLAELPVLIKNGTYNGFSNLE